MLDEPFYIIYPSSSAYRCQGRGGLEPIPAIIGHLEQVTNVTANTV